MENISDKITDIPKESLGFLNHVFNFNKDNKCEIMNIIQYSVLSIIPAVVILKIIKHIIPEEDDQKNNLELSVEIIGQLILMILGMWFSHKAIIYIPTYSECKYSNFNLLNVMLPFIILMFTMQTKLGSKINILYQRLIDIWEGNNNNNNNNNNTNNNNNIKIKQPLPNIKQPNVDYNDTNQLLPNNIDLTRTPNMQNNDIDQMGNNQERRTYNDMYNIQQMSNEPMAANSSDNYTSW